MSSIWTEGKDEMIKRNKEFDRHYNQQALYDAIDGGRIPAAEIDNRVTQQTLSSLAIGAEREDVRERALELIHTQGLLIEVAARSIDPMIQLKATRRLCQMDLAALLERDPPTSTFVQKEAVRLLHDKAAVLHAVMHIPDGELVCGVHDRLFELLMKIETRVLSLVYNHRWITMFARNAYIRSQAIEIVSPGYELLKETLRNDQNAEVLGKAVRLLRDFVSNSNILDLPGEPDIQAIVALDGGWPDMDRALKAVPQEILVDMAIHFPLNMLRPIAKYLEQPQLEQVLMVSRHQAGRFHIVNDAYLTGKISIHRKGLDVDRVTEPYLLALIALGYDRDRAMKAMARLEDAEQMFHWMAFNDPEWEVRERAVRLQVFYQPILMRICASEGDPRVLKAAAEKIDPDHRLYTDSRSAVLLARHCFSGPAENGYLLPDIDPDDARMIALTHPNNQMRNTAARYLTDINDIEDYYRKHPDAEVREDLLQIIRAPYREHEKFGIWENKRKHIVENSLVLDTRVNLELRKELLKGDRLHPEEVYLYLALDENSKLSSKAVDKVESEDMLHRIVAESREISVVHAASKRLDPDYSFFLRGENP